MEGEIINKVDRAGLITVDLGVFVDSPHIHEVDLSDWLDDGFVIREDSFREKITSFNWNVFSGDFVAVFCSQNAIIPTWAYLLIQANLHNIAEKVFFCDKKTVTLLLFNKALIGHDFEQYRDKRVFLKTCGETEVPLAAISLFSDKLFPIVKSLFYGEPCSGFPLIKN